MAKRVSGITEIFIGNAPVVGNPTDNPANWKTLGKPLNGHEPNMETGNVEDGKGAPIATDASNDHLFELIDMNSFDEIRTPEDARTRQDVAHKLLNGDFRIWKNQKVFVDYNPNPGKGKIQTLMFEHTGAIDKWSLLRAIVVPI